MIKYLKGFWLKHNEILGLIIIFLIWRLAIFLIGFLATIALPEQSLTNFYHNISSFWSSWTVFDSGWYDGIANHGYFISPHSFAFFPLFPILIKIVSAFTTISTTFSAIIIANIFAILAIIFLYKLAKLDHSKETSERSVFYLLLFPTAFYLSIGYNESLFLFLAVASFYFARKDKWLWAGILAGFASATRLVGISLFLALIIEYLEQRKWNIDKIKVDFLAILFAPLGLISYMLYLERYWNDPLKFLHAYSGTDWSRSVGFQSFIILFDQTKQLFNFDNITNLSNSLSQFFSESIYVILFLIFAIFVFIKIRKSYGIFMFSVLLFPLLSGSLASVSRYVMILFPAYILLASWGKNKYINFFIIIFSSLMLGFYISLFVNGWWVA